MNTKRFVPVLALTALAALAASDARAQHDASLEHAARAQEDTLGLDLDDARAELAQADASDPNVELESARLAIYEARCDEAAALLARPELAKSEHAQALADIARGCARVTAAIVSRTDEQNAVEVRFQDEHDAPLFPFIVETVVKARDALTKDLQVTWPKPTRIIVVRDLLSLSAMTGLPYKSAQTTGTVAVAKWGRVTLLSPRASHHGYQWRDTIAHELTHLAVTRATRDRAPLWLQEGVAKREEVRWREPGPFDDRPTPDAVAQRGIELKLDLPLDKLGPSIAMLSSADAAMVAFAEVTSFIRFYAQTAGDDALPRLLASIRTSSKDANFALQDASGADFHAWDLRWRKYLSEKPREPLPPFFGLGSEPGGDVRDLRDRARLAELLLGREHPPEALGELDRVKAPAALDDASFRYLRARALELGGRQADAQPLVGDPKVVLSSYGPWWALRGRFAVLKGDQATADASFAEALAADPLDVEVACEAAPSPRGDVDPAAIAALPPDRAALCEAAKARKEPPFGDD